MKNRLFIAAFIIFLILLPLSLGLSQSVSNQAKAVVDQGFLTLGKNYKQSLSPDSTHVWSLGVTEH